LPRAISPESIPISRDLTVARCWPRMMFRPHRGDTVGRRASGVRVDGQFRVLDYQRGDAHRLALIGELDLVSAPALIELVSALCQDGARQLLLDISELAFADSTGLRALLSAETLCAEHYCQFGLTRGTEQLERLFEIMRLFQDLRPRAEPDGTKQRPVVLWPPPVELTGNE